MFMNWDKMIQAINWETILTIYKKDYDKACEIWDKYRHLFLFEISSDFALWATKLNVSINELYSVYTFVKNNFKNLDSKVQVIVYDDLYWPKQINDFPYPTRILYCMGNLDLLNKKNVAIIGSKAPKKESVEKLDKVIASLIKEEIIITSGLSFGVQGHAAVKSLASFSPVIAVIATSFDKCYPKEHKKIQDYIAKEGGLVISRVAPNDNNLKWNILLRNRLMCAISSSLFILEEVDGGGAINLADYSLKNKKEVYFFSSQKKEKDISWPKKLENNGAISIRYPGDLPRAILNKPKKNIKNKKNEKESNKIVQLSLF